MGYPTTNFRISPRKVLLDQAYLIFDHIRSQGQLRGKGRRISLNPKPNARENAKRRMETRDHIRRWVRGLFEVGRIRQNGQQTGNTALICTLSGFRRALTTKMMCLRLGVACLGLIEADLYWLLIAIRSRILALCSCPSLSIMKFRKQVAIMTQDPKP